MSYMLGQFNQAMKDASSTLSADNLIYMTPMSLGTAKRRATAGDVGVSGSGSLTFYDECVVFDEPLSVGTNYYFHAKIKRLANEQIFYVYLVNYKDTEEISEDVKTQYLQTITIQGGTETEWVDWEIICSPLQNFDCLLFQLQRNTEDYQGKIRYPFLVYEELSKINNVISGQIKYGASLLKIGVQSHPGLMMCINGQEIHIGRSGIYEIRNGVITIEFLSVIQAATEDYNGANPLIVDGKKVTIEEYLAYLASLTPPIGKDNTVSSCIFELSKLRAIDAFCIDYMYEEA